LFFKVPLNFRRELTTQIMYRIIALLVILATVQAKIQITMLVFSGTRDPSWTLSGHLELKALQYMKDSLNSDIKKAPFYQMGYRGFLLQIDNKEVTTVYGYEEFEYFLLQTWPERLRLPQVIKHVQSVISKRISIRTTSKSSKHSPFTDVKDKCDIPVVGADNSTIYNPQTDCCGFFIRYQTENNCYDYGNDIVTNTFAQPGRGSGHRWDYDTCDSVREAAERDGLVWYGTVLPTGNPPNGHYISLHIWPNTNFHWLRKDTNLPNHWSHKPGGTPVRDVDNNGKKITDPSKADVSPWSQFCGYMVTVPSKVTIN